MKALYISRYSRFLFTNRNTWVEGEDGEQRSYPCIVLLDRKYKIPVSYTGLERYLCSYNVVRSSATLSKQAFSVCKFLNYLLHRTRVTRICDVTEDDLHGFLNSLSEDNDIISCDSWEKTRNAVYDFLNLYYLEHKAYYEFKCPPQKLIEKEMYRDMNNHRLRTVVKYSDLGVKKPRAKGTRKFRTLQYGYLDLLLFVAEEYDPELVLAIALQAYAGLREGEVVNLTCGDVQIKQGVFGTLGSIDLVLKKANFWRDKKRKTNPGAFKQNQERTQKVYYDFVCKVEDLYNRHIMRRLANHEATEEDAPLFLNKWHNPLTVQSYSARLKKLFVERFVPLLIKVTKRENTLAQNKAYIEAYQREYPGAHMLRHWFTMYLITKANITNSGELMQWRNDHSIESILPYLHFTETLRRQYDETMYRFQRTILDRIMKGNENEE